MAKRLTAVRMTGSDEQGDGGEHLHIPGAGLIGSHTLCGFVDLPGSETVDIASAAEITCEGCLAVLKAALPYKQAVKR